MQLKRRLRLVLCRSFCTQISPEWLPLTCLKLRNVPVNPSMRRTGAICSRIIRSKASCAVGDPGTGSEAAASLRWVRY